MAGLLYFISGDKPANDSDILELCGLSEKGQLETVNANKGPGGSQGVVAFHSFSTTSLDAGSRPLIGYYPKKQTWHKANNGAYWIGWETFTPPGPSDLLRPEPINGHSVMLADGNEWLIPVARIFPQGSALPQALILGPDGELIAEGLPKYAAISASADRVWAEFQRSIDGGERPESEAPLTIKDQFDIAIEALSINYAIGKWEVSALRILTTENVIKILQALIDVPALIEVAKSQAEAIKKKDHASTPAGSSSNGGKPDDALPTSRHTPTLTGSVKGAD